MREGDAARLGLAGKRRPAIVIDVRSDLVRVAYGTTHEGLPPTLSVSWQSRQGRKLALSTDTVFCGANTAWALPSEIELLGNRVSVELLLEVRRLVEEHDAELEEPEG